jgi:hypothetical protein
MVPERRGRIRRVIGKEAEEYVARFPSLTWQSSAGQLARNDPQKLDPADRAVVLMRIADLMEHLDDLDLLYYAALIRNRYLDSIKPASEIARRLGCTARGKKSEDESSHAFSRGARPTK